MSNRLNEIIREYYIGLRNPEILKLFKKVSHIAGLILADMYEIYESSHERELLTEIKFFLDLKNPIKHIINILNNSGSNGTMSVDDAILEEYKIIKSTSENNYDKFSLLEIIEEVYLIIKDKRELYQTTNKDITSMIIDKINEYRIINRIDDDTKIIASQQDLFQIILDIVVKKNAGEDLKQILKEVYFTILRRNGNDINGLEKFIKTTVQESISQILDEMKKDKLEIHQHLEHVGKHTHECLTEMCEINTNILSEVVQKKQYSLPLQSGGSSNDSNHRNHGRRNNTNSSMF